MNKRHEQIVFISESETSEFFAALNKSESAALEYLKQWHYSGEHDTSDNPAHGTDDDTYHSDGYLMSWNTGLAYAALTYDTEHESKRFITGHECDRYHSPALGRTRTPHPTQ